MNKVKTWTQLELSQLPEIPKGSYVVMYGVSDGLSEGLTYRLEYSDSEKMHKKWCKIMKPADDVIMFIHGGPIEADSSID